MPTAMIGGKGVISVVSNLEPGKTSQMMEAAMAGDVARAKALHYELFDLMGAMFCYPSRITSYNVCYTKLLRTIRRRRTNC